MYRQFLEEQGLQVVTAPDAPCALRCLEVSRPDLIVAELALPGMDGIELCRVVGKLFGRQVPVLIVTAFTSPYYMATAKIAGAARVLAKPCTPEKVQQCIRTLLVTWSVAHRQSMELHRLMRALMRDGFGRPASVRLPVQEVIRTGGGQLVGTLLATDSGLILDADAGAAGLTGYATADLVGNSIWSLCPPEWREEYRAVWRWSQTSGRLRGSIDIMSVNGGTRVFLYEAVPERSLGTNLCAFLPEPLLEPESPVTA